MQKPLMTQSTSPTTQTTLQRVPLLTGWPNVGLKNLWEQYPQINRIMSHLVLMALVLGIITVGKIQLSQRQLKAPSYVSPQPISVVEVKTDTGQPLTLPGVLKNRNSGVLLPAAVPHTIIPDRTQTVEEITSYEVQIGDTIYGIAAQFDLAPETILWANPNLENNPDLLFVGQEVIVIPVDGVYHQVGSNDTIETIATTFKVDAEAIVDYHLNDLDPENPLIVPGQWLIVPGGTKPYVPKYVSVAVDTPAGALNGTGAFRWPASGTITQEYWGGHRALDIGAWVGAPIYAADSGYVVSAQWDDSGYGRVIVIDHGNGFHTLYAHLNVLYVSAGDEVAQGQQIAEMGSTGNSTGPHLHFEVMLNGVKRNPWGFLP